MISLKLITAPCSLISGLLVIFGVGVLPSFAADELGADSNYATEVNTRFWEETVYDEQHDIRVFLSDVKGSKMKAFKGTTILESSLTAPVALLQDVSRAHEWVFNCKAMALIEESTPTNALYYAVTSMPWPVKDRDSVSEVEITQDPNSYAVRVSINARNDIFPESDDHIRINDMAASWLLEPLGGGELRVTYEAFANPGGGLPLWLVNRFVVDAPLNTLREFRNIVLEDQYQAAIRDYITH